MNPCLWHC